MSVRYGIGPGVRVAHLRVGQMVMLKVGPVYEPWAVTRTLRDAMAVRITKIEAVRVPGSRAHYRIEGVTVLGSRVRSVDLYGINSVPLAQVKMRRRVDK